MDNQWITSEKPVENLFQRIRPRRNRGGAGGECPIFYKIFSYFKNIGCSRQSFLTDDCVMLRVHALNVAIIDWMTSGGKTAAKNRGGALFSPYFGAVVGFFRQKNLTKNSERTTPKCAKTRGARGRLRRPLWPRTSGTFISASIRNCVYPGEILLFCC